MTMLPDPRDAPGQHLPGLRTFPWRFVVYGAVLLYLYADLYLLGGPLKRRIDAARGDQDAEARALAQREGIAGAANGYPIYLADLDLAADEYLLRNGSEVATLSRERLNAIRRKAYGQLEVQRLLWQQNQIKPTPAPEPAVERERARLSAAFETEEDLLETAAALGLDEARLDAFLRDQVSQTAWLESTIAAAIAVSDEEVTARHADWLEDTALVGDPPPPELTAALRAEIRAALEAEKREAAVDMVVNRMLSKAKRRPMGGIDVRDGATADR